MVMDSWLQTLSRLVIKFFALATFPRMDYYVVIKNMRGCELTRYQVISHSAQTAVVRLITYNNIYVVVLHCNTY